MSRVCTSACCLGLSASAIAGGGSDPYDGANTYVHASSRGTHRICRTCNRAAAARYKLKQGDME